MQVPVKVHTPPGVEQVGVVTEPEYPVAQATAEQVPATPEVAVPEVHARPTGVVQVAATYNIQTSHSTAD